MLRERLKEIEWKSVAIIAIPLLAFALVGGFLLVRDDGVSNDTLRRAQYSESARNVRISEPSPTKEVGEYAVVSSEVSVDTIPPADESESVEEESSATAGKKLGENDPESTIDPEEDGTPVPEGEEATGEPVAPGAGEGSTSDEGNAKSLSESLTEKFIISDGEGVYMVDFYTADTFLASGRFASEEEADFSVDALEELMSDVDPKSVQQIGFFTGNDHSGAYISYSTHEDTPPTFRAYITDDDTVAVIEGSSGNPANGFPPDFITTFNLTTPQEN